MAGRTLEHLRVPLEEKKILVSRSGGSCIFPANFLFAAAMNPCPCGHFPDMNKCTCSTREIQNYMSKISQPILDRIDIRVDVPAAKFSELVSSDDDMVSSAQMRKKVEKAFGIQKERYKEMEICFNGELSPNDIGRFCASTAEAGKLLENTFTKMNLSARAYHRILKLARTIADLEGADLINESHISEAFCFRAQSFRGRTL